MQKLFKNWGVFQGVQVSGTNSLTFQQNMVEGSETAWTGQRWDTEPVIRTSSLSLEGPVWKEFRFKADLSSTGYGPAYSRWVVGYVGHDTALYYGDLNIDLTGNQYVSFSKPVAGWQLDQRIGQGLARFFYSEEKGITRYQSFAGNNTSGPFFLTYTPVIEGTEVVKINEQIQVLGQDYKLDYQSGQLWFEPDGAPPKIIPDTATVAVSYQSSGYQSGTGTVYGARAELPLQGERVRVGVTLVKQDRGGSGTGSQRDTVGYQEDIFQGSGSTGPFDVNYRPIIPNGSQVVYQGNQQVIQQALTVLVDNVEQGEGVDYDSYRQIGRIIFRRSVPPTSLVAIRYFYDLSTSTASSSLQVTGLDLLYHISPKLSLQAEFGRSDDGTNNVTGDAMRLNMNYSTDRLRLVSEYRDTSPQFTFLDSVGFYRQDKGFDTGLNYKVSDHINFSTRRSQLKSAQGWSFGYSPYGGSYGFGTYSALGTQQTSTTTTALDIDTTRTDFEVRLDFPKWPALTIQRQLMSNSGVNGLSDYKGMSYQFNYAPASKPFTLSATLNQTDQGNLQPSTTDPEVMTLKASNTRQLQMAATYKPSSRLSLSLSRGSNEAQAATGDQQSSSSTSQVSVRWTPSSKLDINLDRTLTNSTGSVSSGYYTTGTFGLASISNPGGGDGDEDDETNRYEDNSSRFSIAYRPSSKLNLDFSLLQRKYTSGGSVGYLADSDQTTRSLTAVYQMSDKLTLNATLGSDQMKFLEEGRGDVANDLLTFGANYKVPNSPWGLGLSYNRQKGTSPTYTGFGENQRMRIVANNLSDLRGQLTCALSDTSELVLTGELSKYSGGYANFDKQIAEIGYRRKLGSLADMTFGYRYIRNMSNGLDDPRYGNTSLTPQDQNYVANTFLVTLGMQFSSSLGGSGSVGQGGYGGLGSGSLSNFGGYRAGPGLGTGYSGYGTGYGSFQGLGIGGGGSASNPFGTGGYGSYGNQSGYGAYGGLGSFGRSGGYSSFGGDFGGFSTGLGDFAGKGQQNYSSGGSMQDLFGPVDPGTGQPAPPPGQSGAEAANPLDEIDIEDWQTLDDLGSIWW